MAYVGRADGGAAVYQYQDFSLHYASRVVPPEVVAVREREMTEYGPLFFRDCRES